MFLFSSHYCIDANYLVVDDVFVGDVCHKTFVRHRIHFQFSLTFPFFVVTPSDIQFCTLQKAKKNVKFGYVLNSLNFY